MPARSAEESEGALDDAQGRPAVDGRVEAIDVAEAPLESIRPGFEQERRMAPRHERMGEGQPRLEGHVETRDTVARRPVGPDVPQVMEGGLAAPEEMEEAVQSGSIRRQLQDAPGNPPGGDDARDEGVEELLVLRCEGEVEEDGRTRAPQPYRTPSFVLGADARSPLILSERRS
jgi:hypothetical protein